jgi:hypothetical protein
VITKKKEPLVVNAQSIHPKAEEEVRFAFGTIDISIVRALNENNPW